MEVTLAPDVGRLRLIELHLQRLVDRALMRKFFSPCDDLLVCGGIRDAVNAHDRRDERAKHAAAETIRVPYVFKRWRLTNPL